MRNGKLKEIPEDKNLLDAIKDVLNEKNRQIKELEKENEKLRNQNGPQEQEECMASLCYLSEKEEKADRDFRDEHYKKCKNGSKYLYELTGTGVGTIIKIKCPVCNEEKDITDTSCW